MSLLHLMLLQFASRQERGVTKTALVRLDPEQRRQFFSVFRQQMISPTVLFFVILTAYIAQTMRVAVAVFDSLVLSKTTVVQEPSAAVVAAEKLLFAKVYRSVVEELVPVLARHSAEFAQESVGCPRCFRLLFTDERLQEFLNNERNMFVGDVFDQGRKVFAHSGTIETVRLVGSEYFRCYLILNEFQQHYRQRLRTISRTGLTEHLMTFKQH